MTKMALTGATTSLTLGRFRMTEAVVARRTAPVTSTGQGTGLPIAKCSGTGVSVAMSERTRLLFADTFAYLGALGVDGVTGVDQVQGTTAVHVPAVINQGDPPRRTPSRC